MKNKFATVIIALVLAHSSVNAQDRFPNTLTIESAAESPAASLADIAWLQGHWHGQAFGGVTEEVWTPPLGGSMMAAFKLVAGGEVKFYELVIITEESNTLMLRLKHFHGDLKGWEEKDETVDFPLVKVGENRVFFDGFTFEKVNDDEMNVYVRIQENEDTREHRFNYQRLDHITPAGQQVQIE